MKEEIENFRKIWKMECLKIRTYASTNFNNHLEAFNKAFGMDLPF